MNRKLNVSLVLIALAILIVTTNVIFVASSAHAASSHTKKDVKTTIRLRMATQIGSTTLPPGKYTVKITAASDASDNSTVQFSILQNPYGDDFNPPYDEVVVLSVKASVMELGAPAASTELIPTSGDNNKASALEIRGNSAEYVFGGKTASSMNEH